jgi:hypothetical protein
MDNYIRVARHSDAKDRVLACLSSKDTNNL